MVMTVKVRVWVFFVSDVDLAVITEVCQIFSEHDAVHKLAIVHNNGNEGDGFVFKLHSESA